MAQNTTLSISLFLLLAAAAIAAAADLALALERHRHGYTIRQLQQSVGLNGSKTDLQQQQQPAIDNMYVCVCIGQDRKRTDLCSILQFHLDQSDAQDSFH